MQWALEHPILTFILGAMFILTLSDLISNYFRYKMMKLSEEETVDKYK